MSPTQPRAARLPSYAPKMVRRSGERLRGLVAVAAILALVFAVPWALWTFGGAPWPTSAPSMDWLTQPIGSDVVLRVLFFVLWVAWLHFVICLVVEFFAERRGHGMTAQVPGGGVGTQSLARRLVAAALLLVGSAAVTVPAASAATGSTTNETVSASVETKASAHAESRTSDDTVAKKAQAKPKVATGGRITYTVQPPHGRHYDSLWDISERFLGDGRRYKEVFDLNKGKLQADGRTLREADLIHPGWVLTMPDDAKGASLTIREEQSRPGGSGRSGSASGGEGTATADGGASDGGAGGAGLGAGGGAGSQVGGGAGAAPQVAENNVLVYGVGGALVAAGLMAGLLRRRGWNGGGEDALTPEDETPLRLAADEGQARFVDRALRGLAHAMHESGRPMPSVYAAYVDDDVFTLAISPAVADAPPEGWYSDDDGRMWTVDRATAEALEVPREVLAPYPGLVTVGTLDDGTLVLLDLETAPGLVSLGGDLETAREVGASMAVELATNLWSDDVSVTLVGFGDDLTELAPHRTRRVDNLDDVLVDLEQHRSRQHNVCVRSGLDSVIRGRQMRADRELWKPQFLVLSGVPSQEHLARLGELAADPRHAIGVVTIGDVVSAPWRMVVGADGRLTNNLLGLEVTAQRLGVAAYTKVVDLFRRADAGARIDPNDLEPLPTPGLAPAMLELDIAAPVSVQLFGPVVVDAPGPIDDERRDLATEIVAYVGMHPDGVHPSVLDSAIWPRGVTDEVRNAAIGHVQRWLGENAAGEPRLDQDEQGRWRLDLTSVRVDWHVFQALLDRAHRGGDPTNDLALALSMVQGPGFDQLPAHRYSWLARSTHLRDINVTVVDATRQLADLAARAQDPVFAREALRTGLLVVPDCEELWRQGLRLAARFGSTEETAEVAGDMYAAIAEHGSPRGASAETDALVDELLPGYRRRVA
ncbi:MAG: hypothetical protein GEU96_02825 [Propionibacteriales bacterium]|nr:hypothetical protein [Propionibacteriales bacterium]